MPDRLSNHKGIGRRRAALFGMAAIELTTAVGILRHYEEPHTITDAQPAEVTMVSQSAVTEGSVETVVETIQITVETRLPTVEEEMPATIATSVEETQPPETTQALPVDCTSTRYGNREKAQIAFTFDDSGESLVKILEALDSRGVKGTFFLMAGELTQRPDVWREAAENGHLILNHTVNHNTDLESRSAEKIRDEILGWEETAREVLGDEYVDRMKTDFPYFRTPGGDESERLRTVLGELGYTKIIFWSVEDIYFASHDKGRTTMDDHYVEDAENGAIFLLHSGNCEYVGDIVDRLTEEGYAFVTVDEVLE